jgi:diaminohydroxyphosphoribosylaminopyrimidine deaminase/5-amino-6-(5-phosphoribosylamino)uracil reductase
MLVHKWRSEESAFMVGANTAKNDNPRLTVRDWSGRNPTRIVADRDLSLSSTLHLFNSEAPTIVFNSLKDEKFNNLKYIKTDFNENMIEQMLNKLYDLEIQSIVVEGGRQMLEAFITKNLWDEARVFTGNRYFLKGIKAPVFDFIPVSETMVGDSHLRFYRNSLSK